MGKVSTGTIIGASGNVGGTAAARATDAGMELSVLFDAKSTTRYSPDFIVRPGEAMLLSAFGMVSGEKAIVEKLRYDATSLPFGGMCEGAEQFIGAQTQAEDVTQCGLWALNPCQNTGVLALPGTFRLRLNSTAETSIGTIYVDAMRLKSEEAALIPDELFFGNTSGSGCN